jgi:hypothetical protein
MIMLKLIELNVSMEGGIPHLLALREEIGWADHPTDINLCFIVSVPGDGRYSNARSIDRGAVVYHLTCQEPNMPPNVELGDARAI